MFNRWFLSVALLILSSTSFAKVEYLRLGSGKVLAYEQYIKNPEAPTLVLLPGVNRALTMEDSSVRVLSEKGWNLLLPSLSAHPLSVRGLEKSETPYFLFNNRIRSKNFAEDVSALVNQLKVKNAVPVSLSYTSSVAAFLDTKKFPHIIETVPMGVSTEADPESAKNAELWEGWMRLNPFMASIWIRQARDLAYSTFWGQVVDANLKADPNVYGEKPRVSDVKAGYVTIARAAEDFDFPQWDFQQEARTRDFILAENEDIHRLQNQIAVIKKYKVTGKPLRVVVVARSGHVLPSDRPYAYSTVIGLLATQPAASGVQFCYVDSDQELTALNWQGEEALNKWIDRNAH